MHARRTICCALLSAGVLALMRDARAQELPGPTIPGKTPQAPRDDWPRLSPEELQLAPARPAAPPEPVLPPPVEPPAPRFGDPGEVVVTGAASVGISSTAFRSSDASLFTIAFSPGLDVFLVRGFSVGGDIDVRYESSKGYAADGTLGKTDTTTLSGGPRLGFNLPFGELVSWYPRVTVGLASVHRAEKLAPSAGTSRSTETSLFVSAFAPLLLHPKPHLFFGVGPAVFHEFDDGQSVSGLRERPTTLSARFVLGGWWGGHTTGAEVVAPEAAVEAAPPRFGARGQWVFTGEAGGGVWWTSNKGSDASTTVVRFAPGVDYFLARHFSAGLSGSTYYRHQGRGAAPAADTTAFGVAPRLGGNLPLASWLSLYARGSVSFAHETTEGASGARGATVVAVELYAPLLVHVATHAFVGFGPYLSHGLSRSVDRSPGNNTATRVGAALLVGGWL